MVKYEKPVVSAVEDSVEDVYMASGASASDCWTVSAPSVQDWNGSHHVFEVHSQHSTSVVHITTQVVYTLKFSNTLTDAYSEYGTTFSGDTVVVTRDLHANGYNSGDNVTFKVWAKAADEATTKALTCLGVDYVCRHETNVQGGID